MSSATAQLDPVQQNPEMVGEFRGQSPEIMAAQIGVTPEQFANMSQADIEAGLNAYGAKQLDTLMSGQVNAEDLFSTIPKNQDATAESARETSEAEVKSLFDQIVDGEFNKAKQNGMHGVEAIESVADDLDVNEVQAKVDAIFGGIVNTEEMKQLEVEAIAEAVKNRSLVDKNEIGIVEQAVNGEALSDKVPEPVLAAGKSRVIEGSATKSPENRQDAMYGAKDVIGRNNGNGKRLLHSMAVKSNNFLSNFGIKSKDQSFAGNQDNVMAMDVADNLALVGNAVGAKEHDITQPGRGEDALDKVVGQKIIEAVANHDVDAEGQRTLSELDEAAISQLGQDVEYYNQTGKINRITAQNIGRVLIESMEAK